MMKGIKKLTALTVYTIVFLVLGNISAAIYGKNIAVYIKVDAFKNKLSNQATEKGLTQTLITQLALPLSFEKKIRTFSYEKTQMIFKEIEKQKGDITLENIISYNKTTDYSNNKIDYIVIGELENFKRFFTLTINIYDLKRKKYILEDQNKVYIPYAKNQQAFFRFSAANAKELLLTNPKVFKLINPLGENIVKKIQQELKMEEDRRNRNKPKAKNSDKVNKKKKQIEIMFVVDSSKSMRDELITLKNKLKEIVEYIKLLRSDIEVRISITDYKSVYQKYRANILPFTQNISKVEEYIDSLVKSEKDDNMNDLRYGLDYGVTKGDWSEYRDHSKIIFFLTDQPVYRGRTSIAKRKKDNIKNNLVILPFEVISDSSKLTRTEKQIQQQLIKQLQFAEHGSIIHDQAQRFINQNRNYFQDYKQASGSLKRKFNVRYLVTGVLHKTDEYYKITVKMLDMKTGNIIINGNIENRIENSISALVIPLSKKIRDNVRINLTTKTKKVRTDFFDPGFREVVDKAKSKAIHVYTIGCSGINKNSQPLLRRISQKLDGDYVNLSYRFSYFLTNYKKVNFIYNNQELYQYIQHNNTNEINVSAYDFRKWKNITLGHQITHVENVKYFLLKEDYPIINSSASQKETIENNLHQIVKSVVKKYIEPSRNYKQIVVESEGFFIPIQITKLKAKEYRLLRRWAVRGDTIIIGTPIIPSAPTKVKFREHDQNTDRVLFFKFHPDQIRIFAPGFSKIIPNFLIKSIKDINLIPYFFKNAGVSDKKYWFIKAKIEKVY